MKLLLLIKSTIRREKLYCRERWREGVNDRKSIKFNAID